MNCRQVRLVRPTITDVVMHWLQFQSVETLCRCNAAGMHASSSGSSAMHLLLLL
jgi:hypothetical protein